jgi:hypothetical protein
MMSGYHLGKLVAPFTWIGSCNLQVLIAWLDVVANHWSREENCFR